MLTLSKEKQVGQDGRDITSGVARKTCLGMDLVSNLGLSGVGSTSCSGVELVGGGRDAGSASASARGGLVGLTVVLWTSEMKSSETGRGGGRAARRTLKWSPCSGPPRWVPRPVVGSS